MKGRSHRPPVPTVPMPMDDWIDGSWTVDCPCGVTFDDGEEMVKCDECGVWVHTRCSRYVREEASFTCDKCEAKKPRSSSSGDPINNCNNVAAASLVATNNEETEVAQLLAELPTKADPYLPAACTRTTIRLWTGIPMEKRVHVQGVPGGDPALFDDVPTIFTSDLWKCTGYVPKKFNFKYKEFPCWDDDESETPANAGAADLLMSMSKDMCNNTGHTLVKKERTKSRGIAVCSSKRKEEDSTGSKDKTARKKARICDKAASDDKNTGSVPRADVRNSSIDLHAEGAAFSEFQEVKCDNKKLDHSLEPTVDLHSEVKGLDGGLKNILVVKTSSGVLTSIGSRNRPPPKMPVRSEKVELQDSDQPNISCTLDESVTSSQAASLVSKVSMEEEDSKRDLDCRKQHNGENYQLVNLKGGSSNIHVEAEQSKSTIGEPRSIIPHVPSSSLPPDSIGAVSFGHTEVKVEKNQLEDENGLGNTEKQTTTLTNGKLDSKKPLSVYHQKGYPSDDHQNDEIGNNFSFDSPKLQNDDKQQDMRQQECDNLPDKDNSRLPKELGLKEKEPAGTVVTLEEISEQYALFNVEESTKLGPLDSNASESGGHNLVIAVRKAASMTSAPDGSKLPHSCSFKSPGTTSSSTAARTVPFTKRAKVNSDSAVKKINTVNGLPMEENIRGGTSRQSIKPHLIVSGSSGDKPSKTSKTIHASISKHKPIDSKEHIPCPSKTSSENSASSSGSGRPAVSSRSRSTSGQIKHTPFDSCPKNERITPSSSQTSNKVFNHSTTMHPPTSINASTTLSDEELAKRLHQELNSSPRVSRVPRGFHAGGNQFASPVPSSLLSKRSSSSGSGGKAQLLVPRRKNKDDTSKGRSHSRESPDETEKLEDLSLSAHKKQPGTIHKDGSTKKDAHRSSHNALPSSKTTGQLASVTVDGSGSASPTLPGLIDEILKEGRNMTYEELCDAVFPHWPSLRKPNGDRYAYSSHSVAVLDCLRNRNEWCHLVDPGPRTNSSKKRKSDNQPFDDGPENETAKLKVSVGIPDKSEHLCTENFTTKGKRRARKRRKLALQGRVLQEIRERQRQEVASDGDLGSFSAEGSESLSSEASEGTRKHHNSTGTFMSSSSESD